MSYLLFLATKTDSSVVTVSLKGAEAELPRQPPTALLLLAQPSLATGLALVVDLLSPHFRSSLATPPILSVSTVLDLVEPSFWGLINPK